MYMCMCIEEHVFVCALFLLQLHFLAAYEEEAENREGLSKHFAINIVISAKLWELFS